MADGASGALQRVLRIARMAVLVLVFIGLAASVLDLPAVSAGLANAVSAALPDTAAGSAITATLLDFRGYDTLLELAVLLLAAIAIRALQRGGAPRMPPDDEILTVFSRAIVPVMILIAGYLLMAGFDAAGGAFQAGAILAAAGVLLVLAGRQVPLGDQTLTSRLALAVGLAVFVAVGAAGMLIGDAFLDHPKRNGGGVVLMLELGVAVSVAMVLLELFVGVLRRGNDGHATKASGTELP